MRSSCPASLVILEKISIFNIGQRTVNSYMNLHNTKQVDPSGAKSTEYKLQNERPLSNMFLKGLALVKPPGPKCAA